MHPLKEALNALVEAAHVADYHRDCLSDDYRYGNPITPEMQKELREAASAERRAVQKVLAMACLWEG